MVMVLAPATELVRSASTMAALLTREGYTWPNLSLTVTSSPLTVMVYTLPSMLRVVSPSRLLTMLGLVTFIDLKPSASAETRTTAARAARVETTRALVGTRKVTREVSMAAIFTEIRVGECG